MVEVALEPAVDVTTYFQVTAAKLAGLSANDAVALFRQLLWAEARRLKIPRNRIHVPDRINVPDGGVDAKVEASSFADESNIIFPGSTVYQIKTGDSFNPTNPSRIVAELFTERPTRTPAPASPASTSRRRVSQAPAKRPAKPTRRADLSSMLSGRTSDDLGDSVKACLDAGGTYVLACFSKDLAETQRSRAKQHLVQCFKHCGYADPKVEVWGTSNLVGVLNLYPSLCLDVDGRDARATSYRRWAHGKEMQRHLRLGRPQEEFIESVRKELRDDTRRQIRICGEPGIGKTRLILEASSAEDLSPLVVYWDGADQFLGSKLFAQLSDPDSEQSYSLILVVDECSPTASGRIWDQLQSLKRIKLITIDHEFDEGRAPDLFKPELPPLSEDQIAQILQDHGASWDVAVRYAPYCSGSPRVAHVLGSNLDLKADDLLSPSGTMPVIWNRYIQGRESGAEARRERKLVLTHLALFKRFGVRGRFRNERQAIMRLIQARDPRITEARFDEIVRELRDQRILQGQSTYYITPKLLHIWLWREWWKTYGESGRLDRLLEELPEQLFEWFAEMFRYAEESGTSKDFVDGLLGEDGPFADGERLHVERWAKFFFFLAEASPAKALASLQRTLGGWSRERLLAFTAGRRYVVAAIEKVAFLRELFVPAARLLLRLAETEQEPSSNNASSLFVALFSRAPGLAAPTAAPPGERLPVLHEAMESPSRELRLLGIAACRKALGSGLPTRALGAEHRGIARAPEPWVPRSAAEVEEALVQVWRLLAEKRRTLPEEEERRRAALTLLERAPGMLQVRRELLSRLVLDTLDEMERDRTIDREALTAAMVRARRMQGDKPDPRILEHLDALRERLDCADFPARLRRIVGMHFWAEEYGDKADDVLARKLHELAQEAFRDPEAFRRELSWLLTPRARFAFGLGRDIGMLDAELLWLPEIAAALRAQGESSDASLLAGYLRAVFQRDQERWESELDRVAEDPGLQARLAELTSRSGTTERAAERVLRLARTGKLPVRELGRWARGYGHDLAGLSPRLVRAWLDLLLGSREPEVIGVTLELIHAYTSHLPAGSPPLDRDLAMRALLHDEVFSVEQPRRSFDAVYWAALAGGVADAGGEPALDLLGGVLSRWTHPWRVFPEHQHEGLDVLDRIVRRDPIGSWGRIRPLLGSSRSARTGNILSWMQGWRSFSMRCEGVISVIPRDAIWAWVGEDPSVRAPLLAAYVPKTLDPDDGGALTRELLIRHGDRTDVREALQGNFRSEGWEGRRSRHYANRLAAAARWQEGESEPRVRAWIDEYRAGVAIALEEAKLEEERDDWAAQ